ncbi:MAG TPA: ATP-binding protein [Anaerolineales bacterium]|nr:ATP-binding protein [Anaerolineales bacterium]HNB85547.1 ATP-binding protein [Anaerolineales bacterium]HNC90086.1 ATP-binding protein [Anaerolineales bacterium]HND93088.1 ATP-binding protein [Anaerolineales bacterium]HNF35986.1 ATP-binding protein [Anaerolineales bacterium]
MHPEDKSQKRVEKLFSDLEQIAGQAVPSSGDSAAARPTSFPVRQEAPPVDPVVTALTARIHELEAKLEESNLRIAMAEAMLATEKTETARIPAIVYEKEKVGYAFKDENILPLRDAQIAAKELEDAVDAPLIMGGDVIGDIKIEPPSDRPWTEEEERLASAVAQQASLQIQNLRLLSATERARTEAQAATRRFTHESWESFLDGIRNSERIGYLYDQSAVEPVRDIPEHDHRETVKVLDEQIGNLFIKSDPARPLSEEDKEMVAAIARQVSQQVENLRLLADASRARADAEDATRRLSRESWQSYTQRNQSSLGYVYDSIQVSPLTDEFSNAENISLVQPLTVRGETIGRLVTLAPQTHAGGATPNRITPEAEGLAAQIAERVSEQLERLRLTEEIQKRAAELATVATVSTAASTVLNPDELLQQVVDLTKERFGLYHAQVFLADEAWNTLLLAAGSGDIGKQMVMSGNTIPMEKNELLVSRATRERKALISNDVRREESFQLNPLLPDTRSEMAIPMIAGDKVLGVFNVHSVNLNHFTEEDANIYTTLASQVAVSLQNARLYAEQAATVAQLRELDRLKSSFLANMSHELRTPLNSILGFSDVMLEELDGPLTENMRNDLGLIQKNGQHLLHLINDVLDMAKIESGKLNLNIEKFNLQEVIEEVTSITAPFASEKNLSLFLEQDSDNEVQISADKIRIRQVMINLVNNAIKFTERGKISIRAACEDNHVLISVKDTGIGIPHDHLDSVFQEFTQVDTSTTRKAGGTGLGLPISRRLIEMHGGKLWAESSGINGEGSIFYVFLPIEARLRTEEELKVK